MAVAGIEANHRLLEKLFRQLLGERPAYSADAHPAVWMNVQHQADRQAYTVAFLNHQSEDPPLPIPRLSFTLRSPPGTHFTRLLQLPERTPAAFTVDAHGTLQAEVTDLQLFRMLLAEYTADRPPARLRRLASSPNPHSARIDHSQPGTMNKEPRTAYSIQ